MTNNQNTQTQPIITIDDLEQIKYESGHLNRNFEYPLQSPDRFDGNIPINQKIYTINGVNLTFMKNNNTQSPINIFDINYSRFLNSKTDLIIRDGFMIKDHYIAIKHVNNEQHQFYISTQKLDENGNPIYGNRFADAMKKTLTIDLKINNDGVYDFRNATIIGNVSLNNPVTVQTHKVNITQRSTDTMQQQNTQQNIIILKTDKNITLNVQTQKIPISPDTGCIYLFSQNEKIYALTGAQNTHLNQTLQQIQFLRENGNLYVYRDDHAPIPLNQCEQAYIINEQMRVPITEIIEDTLRTRTNPYTIQLNDSEKQSTLLVQLDSQIQLKINAVKQPKPIPNNAIEYIQYHNSNQNGYKAKKESLSANNYESASSTQWDVWYDDFGFAVFSAEYKDTVLKTKPHGNWWNFNRTKYNNLENAEDIQVGHVYRNIELNDDNSNNKIKDIIQINQYALLCEQYLQSGHKLNITVEIQDRKNQDIILSYQPIKFTIALNEGVNDLYYDNITFDLNAEHHRKITRTLNDTNTQTNSAQQDIAENDAYIDVISTPRGIGIMLGENILMIEEKYTPNANRFHNLADGGRTHSYYDLPAKNEYHRIITKPEHITLEENQTITHTDIKQITTTPLIQNEQGDTIL